MKASTRFKLSLSMCNNRPRLRLRRAAPGNGIPLPTVAPVLGCGNPVLAGPAVQGLQAVEPRPLPVLALLQLLLVRAGFGTQTQMEEMVPGFLLDLRVAGTTQVTPPLKHQSPLLIPMISRDRPV